MMYFAFGSNLNQEQMQHRCPNARAVGRATLPNHALRFGGHSARWGGAVATVERTTGSQVEGVLYELGPQDLARLDRFEGAPWVYQRFLRDVRDLRGNRHRAMLYRMPGAMPKRPAAAYLAVLLDAYQRWGLDVQPLLASARESGPARRHAKSRGERVPGSPRKTRHLPRARRPDKLPDLARVFVYGSLLTGGLNHRYLENATWLGEARTSPGFELLDLGRYPAMVPGGTTSVAGELYAVDARTLEALDRLEGHPTYYHRSLVALQGAVSAWAYVMDPLSASGRPCIPSGSWRQHLSTKES